MISLEGFHGVSGLDLEGFPGVSGGFRGFPLFPRQKHDGVLCWISQDYVRTGRPRKRLELTLIKNLIRVCSSRKR